MADDALLTEQLDYYRARAGEYDRWWNREGRFDRGTEANARWFAEAAALEGVLEHFDPRGDVLELACGTGLWTRHLVGYADRLTAVDGSAEVLAINRARVGDTRVEYRQVDIFNRLPEPASFDACVFSSCSPTCPRSAPPRSGQWWAWHCGPAGSCCSATAPAPTVHRRRPPVARGRRGDDDPPADDGRAFRTVKRFYEPRALESELACTARG